MGGVLQLQTGQSGGQVIEKVTPEKESKMDPWLFGRSMFQLEERASAKALG